MTVFTAIVYHLPIVKATQLLLFAALSQMSVCLTLAVVDRRVFNPCQNHRNLVGISCTVFCSFFGLPFCELCRVRSLNSLLLLDKIAFICKVPGTGCKRMIYWSCCHGTRTLHCTCLRLTTCCHIQCVFKTMCSRLCVSFITLNVSCPAVQRMTC